MSEIVACSIEGCERPVVAKALCSKHYQRTLRGKPKGENRGPAPRPAFDRWNEKVARVGTVPRRRPDLGPCWLWQGAVSDSGYARFDWDGGRYAHRFAHEHHIGPVPDGFEVDHLCSERRCVNPGHLEAVTPEENKRRATLRPVNADGHQVCRKGHGLTPENRLVKPGGRFVCRTCNNAATRAWKARRLAIESGASPESPR